MTPDLMERRAVVAFIRYVARTLPTSLPVALVDACHGGAPSVKEDATSAAAILREVAGDIARGVHRASHVRSERAAIVRYLRAHEVGRVLAPHVQRGLHVLERARRQAESWRTDARVVRVKARSR